MEELLAKELELQKQRQKLEMRQQQLKNQKKFINLKDITTPEDIAIIAEVRRETAFKRNAEMLRDLELTSGKLHTQSLCPIECKLKEMKTRFLEGQR